MTPRKSKTVAAWLALLFGVLGLHRIYLHGARDTWAWVHPPVTALGLLGLERLQTVGQDDRLSWLLLPVLGLMVTQATLFSIVYALTPDARWDAAHNGGVAGSRTGWGTVAAAIAALSLGSIALISVIAFGGQKFFEWQLGAQAAAIEPRR